MINQIEKEISTDFPVYDIDGNPTGAINTVISFQWEDGEPTLEGEKYRVKIPVGNGFGYAGKTHTLIAQESTPIRIISTGAMQRRFTIPEEVFIESDPAAKVIKSRLMNSSYADLDYQDTVDGVTYICGVLFTGGIDGNAAIRVAELLIDGTEAESYP